MILFLALILFGAGLYAQNSAYTKNIYRDYGTFRLVTDDGNIVSLSSFVTIQEEQQAIHREEVVKQKALKQLKYEESKTKYHYELYLVSKSVYQGDTTKTWVHRLKIFVDGEDMLKNQFPDGQILSVGTEPTLIYMHHSVNKFCEFELTWERAIYEPRIRK